MVDQVDVILSEVVPGDIQDNLPIKNLNSFVNTTYMYRQKFIN